MHKETIKDEIQLAEDEACIVFDFGCYFPYKNVEILKFDFQLGMETFDDYKINHRYPNKGYQTISKKNGRKVSKIGYPYIFKLSEQAPMLLNVKVGIKDKYISFIFPVITNLTKENPVCALSMHYMFDENKFYISSNEPMESGGWKRHRWLSEPFNNMSNTDIILTTPIAYKDSYTLTYQDTITLYASKIEKLLIL